MSPAHPPLDRGSIGATAADEATHLHLVPADGELWENHGWCVRVRGGGSEFMLWIAFYILRGHPEGRFTVDDVRVAQAVSVHCPSPAAGEQRMQDNPFAVSGVNHSEFLPHSELQVELGGTRSAWALAGRLHENEPPVWRVAGPCGPLEVDLRFDAIAPASWFRDFELIDGYEVLARVTGTIATPEHGPVEVEGVGQHEKVHTAVPIQRRDGAGWLTLEEGERHMWHCGGDQTLAFSMLANQPGERADLCNGQVVIAGRQLHFGRDDVEFREIADWVDPRSGVTIPVGWRIDVRLPEGSLALDVAGYARAYYLWDYLKGSTSLLYWVMADATFAWSPAAAGEESQLRRVPYVAHTNRPFLYWGTPDSR